MAHLINSNDNHQEDFITGSIPILVNWRNVRLWKKTKMMLTRTQFAGIYACIFSFSLIGCWFTTVDISYMM